jgi:citrate lyase subunit beta/citryl-CoA lyase
MSVPASSERFLAKARGLPVDEVMLDLEDSVAPDEKAAARQLAVAALGAGGWDCKLVAVRVNDATTPWAYRDVIAVAEGAGAAVDSLILPKVSDPAAVVWLDVLLGQVERSAGLEPGRIGIEAQIEDAAGRRSRRSRRRRPGSPPWCSGPPTSWPPSACARLPWAASRTGTRSTRTTTR